MTLYDLQSPLIIWSGQNPDGYTMDVDGGSAISG